jgi:hypothetical protein
VSEKCKRKKEDLKKVETRGRMEGDDCVASEPQGGEGEKREGS